MRLSWPIANDWQSSSIVKMGLSCARSGAGTTSAAVVIAAKASSVGNPARRRMKFKFEREVAQFCSPLILKLWGMVCFRYSKNHFPLAEPLYDRRAFALIQLSFSVSAGFLPAFAGCAPPILDRSACNKRAPADF